MTAPPFYFAIHEGCRLPDIRVYAPFRAAVILASEYSQGWQGVVSDWLVDSGCLFMSAWGPDCSSWDDSVDWAFLKRHPAGDADDDSFVHTTWHTEDTLDELFWFVGHCATHPVLHLITLIIDVHSGSRERQMLARFDAAQTLPPD